MNDKEYMEDLLMLQKGVCDLYMHGVLESSTENVHKEFSMALNDALQIQDAIYKKMESKGWYSTETVDQSKLNEAKQSFAIN